MHDLEDAPIGRLLGLAGRMVGAKFQRVLDAEGITHAGWQVIHLLGDGALTQREVADRCYVTPASVTGVVDTLERDGLVVRERDESDRRVVRVSLTRTGRKKLAHARTVLAAEMGPVFADLSPREEAAVRRFLVRTLRRLGADGLEKT